MLNRAWTGLADGGGHGVVESGSAGRAVELLHAHCRLSDVRAHQRRPSSIFLGRRLPCLEAQP